MKTRFRRSGQNDCCWPLKVYRNSGHSSVKEQVHLKIAKTLFYQLTGEFLLLMCFANSVQPLTEILLHDPISS